MQYTIMMVVGDLLPLIKSYYKDLQAQKQKVIPNSKQKQPPDQKKNLSSIVNVDYVPKVQQKPHVQKREFLEQDLIQQKQEIILEGDQKYIYIETWQLNDNIQIYLCKSRYYNSKKIKKILKKLPPQSIYLFSQYYSKLRKLNHPNILIYEDIYLDKDNLIIITDYLQGISLRKFLENKQIPADSQESQIIQEKRILKFYKQIQSSLKYLQDKNIVHGDISSSHIIINEFDKPILIEFSPSEKFSSKQSIHYKIPQKFQQSNNDMWSLGMILIELYFNKKITQLIKNLGDPFQDLKKIRKNIKNQQIKDILGKIVFRQKKIKQQPEQMVIVKQQININEEIKIKQTIAQSENKLQFTSEICSNQTNQEIKIQTLKNFTESFIDLVNTQNQVTKQTIYDTYQRCKQLVDPIQSKSVEQTLQRQNTIQPHPLLILGSVLRQNNKTIYYSEKSTPFSTMSFILLSLQIGLQEKKIRSIVNYAISQKTFNNTKNTVEIKQQIINILRMHYNTQQSDPIITQIEWFSKQKIIVEYYYSQNTSTSNNLRGGANNVSEISAETLVDALQLSPSDLDSRGDIDFVNRYVAKRRKRGGLPYFQPNGWIRYGLNVSRFTQIDGNDNWLRMDGNDGEWAVFYHGLRNKTNRDQIKKVTKIIIQTQFKSGRRQVHQKKNLFIPAALYNILKKNPKALEQYKKQKQVGRGIYGSPLINQVCLRYTTGTQFGNQQYRVAFQCRIHPEKVYISDDNKTFWIVRDPKYIRPYGLLIGKKSDIEKQKDITNKFLSIYKQFQKTAVRV